MAGPGPPGSGKPGQRPPVDRFVRPLRYSYPGLALAALLATAAPRPVEAASTGSRCRLGSFTPSGGKVLARQLVTTKGRTVHEPVLLATVRRRCRAGKATTACWKRAYAAARRHHPGRKLSCEEGTGAVVCKVLDLRRFERRCKLGEDGAACKLRVLRAASHRAPGYEVSVEILPPVWGLDVVLRVDGKLQPTLAFRTSEAVAAKLRALRAAGHRAEVYGMMSRKIRAPYRALVTVRRTRARRFPAVQRLRLTWQPPVSGHRAVMQLYDEADRAGLLLARFSPTATGAVELELACP